MTILFCQVGGFVEDFVLRILCEYRLSFSGL